jgi:hypothetical protein
VGAPAQAASAPRPSVRISEDVPVIDEADICVLGGSCTGAFAAIRAARLGARVILVEKQGHFGGVATVVCTWHSLHDAEHRRQIIAGLTQEITERLKKRGGVNVIGGNASKGFEFSPGELKLALDEMILEAGVRPHLHTLFSAPVLEEGRLTGVIVDGKSGRGVIRAKQFIDATGDGDLCARLGLAQYSYEALLPPTVCAFLANWQAMRGVDLGAAIRQHGPEFNLEEGFVWGSLIPGTDVYMLAGTRVKKVNCAASGDLTRAEIEGRRQVKAILEILRRYHPERKVALHDFPATIGIRDTRHIRCQYQLKGDDVLSGRRFDDAIANGSYRVDIHHEDKPGITLMYLDGREAYSRPGYPAENKRWRPETESNPTFYQAPLRSLVPGRFGNLVLAGRMLDADKTAFSGVRVMVNTNQMGEAAGVAAYLALSASRPLAEVDAAAVRKLLARGGSIVL